jgi:hypothetical protein
MPDPVGMPKQHAGVGDKDLERLGTDRCIVAERKDPSILSTHRKQRQE